MSHYVDYESFRAMILEGFRWPAAIFFSRKCCLALKSGNILSQSHRDMMPYEILNLLSQMPNVKESGLRLNAEHSTYK